MVKYLFTILGLLAIATAEAAESSYLKNNIKAATVFTENKGQIVDVNGKHLPDVLAESSIPGLNVYLTKQGITYVFLEYTEDKEAPVHPVYVEEKKYKISYSRVDVDLSGSTLTSSQLQFAEPVNWKSNHYFNTNESAEALSHYKALTIKNVYPNIDWVWKTKEDGKLEYDFVVHAGGNPASIKMKYRYADLLADSNQLKIVSHHGTLIEGPLAANSEAKSINIAYSLNQAEKEISFSVSSYDPNKDLIIDPPLALMWSAQYGGNFADGLRGVTTDSAGYVYMVGYTTSTNFPTHSGGYYAYLDSTFNGTTDAIILKIDSNRNLRWATYMGGAGNDFANSVVFVPGVFRSYIYVVGSASSGFPIQNLSNSNTYNQPNAIGQDAFILRIATDNLQLEWSSFYGGNGVDEALKVSNIGTDILMCGYTSSTANTFPTQTATTLHYNQTAVTGKEAFAVMFNAFGYYVARDWASVYGGSGDDYATSIGWNNSGLSIAGFSNSTNLPMNTYPVNSYHQNSNAGGVDGFILTMRYGGPTYNSTYFGGTGDDYITDLIPVGSTSYIFTGRTNSADFPVDSVASLNYYQDSLAGGYDAFILKLDTTLKWSTYYGGSGNDAGTALCLGKDAEVWMTGHTFSTDFPVDSTPIMPGAYFQRNNKGNSDGFLAGFYQTGGRFWSTYKGDSCYEYPADIAMDTLFDKLYLVGEGMSGCSGSVDTGNVLNTAGFCWAFGSGSAATSSSDGCFSVQMNFIRQPCFGECSGEATLIIDGARGPVHTLWSNGETGDTAKHLCYATQAFWVQVSDTAGCVKVHNFDLNRLYVGINTARGPSCQSEGLATGVVTGGNPPYTYLWNTGSNLTFVDHITYPGDFQITVTDNLGCSASGYNTMYWRDSSAYYISGWASEPTCNHEGQVYAMYYDGVNWTYPSVEWYLFNQNGWIKDTVTWEFNPASAAYTYQIANQYRCVNGQMEEVYYVPPSIPVDLSLTQVDVLDCHSHNGSVLTHVVDYNYSHLPYHYLWSNGATSSSLSNLLPGNYSVTVTDARGCSASVATQVVDAFLEYGLYANSTIPCANGINGAVSCPSHSGGVSPFSYLWSNGQTSCAINNLTPGQYAVTVTDALGCTTTGSYDLNYPDATHVDFEIKHVGCADTVRYTIIAHVHPHYPWWSYHSYNYTWSTGIHDSIIHNVQSGVYNLQFWDGGYYNSCVSIPPSYNLLIADIQATNHNCALGNSASAIVQGGTQPYQYLWSNGNTSSQLTQSFVGAINLQVTDSIGCIARDTAFITVASPFLVDYSASEIFCSYDSSKVVIFATGGFPPYSGDGVFIMPAGNYNLTVTDSVGCSLPLTFQITAPPPLSIPFTLASLVTCVTDTVLVNVSALGGTPPYAGTGLFAFTSDTIYPLLVTDQNQCIAKDTAYISIPLPLSATYSATPVLCSYDSSTVVINGSGGFTPYTGVGNKRLASGNYNLSVTDSIGCSVPVSFQIQAPQTLSMELTLASPINCYTDTATLIISAMGGTVPYTGTGSFEFTTDTVVQIVVTDSNSCVTDSIVRVDLFNDSITTRVFTDTVCRHDSLLLYAHGFTNPTWQPNNLQDSIYHLNNLEADVVVFVSGRGVDGCMIADTFQIKMDSCSGTGIKNLAGDLSIQVYPNPISDYLYLAIQAQHPQQGLFELFSADAKLVLATSINNTDKIVRADCNLLASGMYVLHIQYGPNNYYSKVVVGR